MARLSLTSAVLLMANGAVFGQCFSGRCASPVQYAPPQYAQLGPTPVGNPPSDRHEWKVIPGYGYGWGLKDAPGVGVVGAPAPKFVEAGAYQPKHGRLFYRIVRDNVYDGLVSKGVNPETARQRVESLSYESIDAYGEHAKIVDKIGDGKILQWLYDHREEILALIRMIVTILMFI